jgi:hypothetical protein
MERTLDFNTLHSVISQNKGLFSTITVRSPNHTYEYKALNLTMFKSSEL